ncbi:filamentous haemagglutinin family protein [Hyphomicrobium album]|uniref:filamentous haemagglutinin family protein n=1 Tax=Hyphomicrobium album TaxID=2665159 RepID=UPI0018AA457D|nr:filamentous haemagglutinin family protein [Hyphomicrobium album]
MNATAQEGAAQAAAAAKRSIDMLGRASQAIQDMRAGQDAARALAKQGVSLVPNGMVRGAAGQPNGLLVAPGADDPASGLWQGADLPTEMRDGESANVTVKQNQQKAILTWESFNVGRETTLYFNQTAGGADAGSWIALNRVLDPGTAPSQILGSIKAEGQVYVINRNGVIFGGASQVNVGTLIASSLSLANEPFIAGLTSATTPVFDGTTYTPGAVRVQAGAQIATTAGGRVLLLGPEVENAGTIETPSGQTVLAAGDRVWLRKGDEDPLQEIRGFRVQADDGATPSLAINSGIISAPQGNITLLGRDVSQLGALLSTTSAAFNGSIMLAARLDAPSGGFGAIPDMGNLVLGEDSVTQILPDATDTTPITDAQRIVNSSIYLMGATVQFNPNAIVQLRGYDHNTPSEAAPGGITIAANRTLMEAGSLIDVAGTTDAMASASRNSVKVELRTNELRDSPLVRGGPLYQRTIYVDASQSGDGWEGTPLADVSGWIGLTERSLTERMASGAPVSIRGAFLLSDLAGQAPDAPLSEFIAKPGSLIDVSGGYVTYNPGFVRVSQLITADGRIISASSADATPDRNYIGIVDDGWSRHHSRWGVTQTYRMPLTSGPPTGYFDQGYVQGAAGGSLSVDVSAAVLEGDVAANVIVGRRQLEVDDRPKGATLSITARAPNEQQFFAGYSVPSLVLGHAAVPLPAGFGVTTALPDEAYRTTYVPESWLEAGFTNLSFRTDNELLLPADVTVDLAPGGSFSASALVLDVEGSIRAPGGSISLNVPENFGFAVGQETLRVGSTAVLSTAGLWTNGRAGGSPYLAVDGGSIALSSGRHIYVERGAYLDVSGGGHVDAQGKVTVGDAGALSISGGRIDPNASGDFPEFTLEGTFAGFGLAAGGRLGAGGKLAINIPGAVTTIVPAAAMGDALMAQPNPGELYLSTDFFSAFGFRAINVTTRGLTLTGGTVLAPEVRSRVASSSLLSLPTGAALSDVTTPMALPMGLRAPMDLTLRAAGNPRLLTSVTSDAALIIEQGAVLRTDPLGKITLRGDQLAIVAGTVEAPGGTIVLEGGTSLTPNSQVIAGQGVWLTETGKLLARGTVIERPLGNGLVSRDVVAGGSVTVRSLSGSTANFALNDSGFGVTLGGSYVVLAAGSLIDVSGTSGQSTLPGAGDFDGRSLPASFHPEQPDYNVASNGGSVEISAAISALIEGDISAHAGGANAGGGSLSIAISMRELPDNLQSRRTPFSAIEDVQLILQNAQTTVVADQGLRPGDNLFAHTNANIRVSADMLEEGGFDNLSLAIHSVTGKITANPAVVVADGLELTLPGNLSIVAPAIKLADNTTATVSANYLSWVSNYSSYQPSSSPSDNDIFARGVAPTDGTGRLTFNANAIDLVGNLALQGVAEANFNAQSDIRLSGGPVIGSVGNRYYGGSLRATGDLAFKAAQVYPTTLSTFALVSNSKISFASSGGPAPTPLSAGGTLQVFAPVIEQNGVLRAPLGTIELGCTRDCGTRLPFLSGASAVPVAQTVTLGAGSNTSVSANGLIIPFGVTQQQGIDWVVPLLAPGVTDPQLSQFQRIFTAPPEKRIGLNAADLRVNGGAVIDASGGGDLYASEFTPGSGGSKDIFAGPNVYAVMPGTQPSLSPFDPLFSGSAQPGVGRQVYLNGADGLSAGVYTLLPGHYARLPGAFRVTVEKSSTEYAIPTAVLTDGANVTAGYFRTPYRDVTDAHWSLFKVMSGAVARLYTEVLDTRANAFYTAKAVADGLDIPRLAQDAGHLTVNATRSLVFQGTGLFVPDKDGRGGLADITADQLAVVTAAKRDAGTVPAAPADYPTGIAWQPLLLAAEDLNRLGVESLLIGGTRSTEADGVHVRSSASAVVIANDATAPLALPEVLLTAATKRIVGSVTVGSSNLTVEVAQAGTGQVVIADGAVIEATGTVAPGQTRALILDGGQVPSLPTLTSTASSYTQAQIQAYYNALGRGQGAFLRVSNGAFLDTIRTNASYDPLPNTPVLVAGGPAGGVVLQAPMPPIQGRVTIGAGARLAAGGSINFNVSETIDLSPQATIATRSLELASNRISLGAPIGSTGFVLNQDQLAALAGVQNLALRSTSTIDFFGNVTLGLPDASGAPLLRRLTLDAKAIVARTAGTVSLTAEQVTLQNQTGEPAASAPGAGARLVVTARDIGGDDNKARIAFGQGSLGISGFEQGVTLSSSGMIVAERDGSLLVQAPLTLDAPVITAGSMSVVDNLPKFNTAAYTITASDGGATPGTWYALDLRNSHGASGTLPDTLLGGRLTLEGGPISIATSIRLPGGIFSANAHGDLTVAAGGVIDAAAKAIQFRDVMAAIDGGTIKLASTGRIAVADGARLDVNGRAAIGALGEGSAGTVSLSAQAGDVSLVQGVLSGAGPNAAKGGTFIFDSATLASYDTLASELVAGGFTKSWDIRVRSGNIVMSGLTKARDVTVAADQGNISLVGRIDASGETGGRVRLWAGNSLSVAGIIDAHGAKTSDSQRGGRVWLGSEIGALELLGGSVIDVAAGGLALGDVTLRAPRTGGGAGTGVDITSLAGAITGAYSVIVEGVKVYDDNAVTADLTPTKFRDVFLADAASFMANETAIKAGLLASNPALTSALHVRAGVEIRNSGNILVRGDALNPVGIDLSGGVNPDPAALVAHFGPNNEPVMLTIRAGGNLEFGRCTGACLTTTNDTTAGVNNLISSGELVLGSLSDGFSSRAAGMTSGVVSGAGASIGAALFDPPATAGDGPDSASFRLAAGADLSAANPLALDRNAVAGAITVAGLVNGTPQVLRTSQQFSRAPDTFADYASLIRTGTGDIDIAATDDLILQSIGSLIYTAGVNRTYAGGTSTQSLPGFSQYAVDAQGTFRLATSSAITTHRLRALAFPVRGGDLAIELGGDLRGNSQGMTYEMTALWAQGELTGTFTGGVGVQVNATFAPQRSVNSQLHQPYPVRGNLAWYPILSLFSGGLGAFGGGDVTVEAGGSVSNVTIALPTNGRVAGTVLTAAAYNPATASGLLLQGGGALSVAAGGNITGLDAYVQQGATTLKAGGDVILGADGAGSITTGTGDVTVLAGGRIDIADRVLPGGGGFLPSARTTPYGGYVVSGISIAQNSSMVPWAWGEPSLAGQPWGSPKVALQNSLQGIFTSAPTGTVSLNALESVTLDTGGDSGRIEASGRWNRGQGILPARLQVLSLQGDIVNNRRFVLYPDSRGTVDLLARGAVTLNQGFVLSDADPAIMPLLENYVAALSPTETRFPAYRTFGQESSADKGGLAFVAGGDAGFIILDAKERDLKPGPLAMFHAPGVLHRDDEEPARIYGMTGDVTQTQRSEVDGIVDIYLAKMSQIYAGRDLKGFALYGQNNRATDVSSLTAGRDITYPIPRSKDGAISVNAARPAAVELSGPGDLLVAGGRNVDLGFSTGLMTLGNIYNGGLPSQQSETNPGQGANITVLTGLGSTTPDYAGFLAAFADPASDNPFAPALVQYDREGNVVATGVAVYNYLLGLPEQARNLQLHRLFFSLIRDSGREHAAAPPTDTDYNSGYVAIDTSGVLDSNLRNYERAFSAIDTLFDGTAGGGDFRGVFSGVRTKAGGDITILSPHGAINIGIATPPKGFDYGGNNAALVGVVTEQGGGIRMYADGNIAVNQSRVFTLNGGNELLISRHGNIDAGRGAKTVQAIQPPQIRYDVDGNLTIIPIGPASGSGIAVLRTLPDTPLSNIDLIAFEGAVDAGDAGIRVSGDIVIVAPVVLNAANISVGGKSTGIPVVLPPNIAGLTEGSSTSGAAVQEVALPAQAAPSQQPSIIIVEVIGYGGPDPVEEELKKRRKRSQSDRQSNTYDPSSMFRVIGSGDLSEEQAEHLTPEERAR